MAVMRNLVAHAKEWRKWLLVLALLFPLFAWGANNQILVVGDASRPYFRSFVEALEAGLAGSGIKVSVATSYDSGTANSYRCVVTVGHDAAEKIANQPLSSPVLHTLITSSLADELKSRNSSAPMRSYLLVEQPVSRLLFLATTALPGRERIGVLFGPSSLAHREEVRRQIRLIDGSLVEKSIESEAELGAAMSFFKGNADLLITLPDPLVVNEGTAKTLILGAYLGNLPLIGYSRALVKAGALMAVYSTPEMLGSQSAALINNSFWNEPALVGAKIYPNNYEVSVNYQVARALAIDLPDEKQLLQRLKRVERVR